MTTEEEKELFVRLLSQRIRQLRLAAGYTNYENFAYDKDIPRAQFGRYEKGQDLRFSSLVKIAQAFNMSLEEFFSEGFEELKNSPHS